MDELERKDREGRRLFVFFLTLGVMGIATGMVAVFLSFGQGNLLLEIAKSAALLVGGFGGGYGFSRLSNR